MSRKHRNRKSQKQPLRCFLFTPEAIKLTQEALKLFVQELSKVEDQSAKATFAREMIQQVNGKLDTMAASVGKMCLTTFDFNEKIVVATAIQLYMLDLVTVSSSARQDTELQRCRQILRFALDPGQGSG